MLTLSTAHLDMDSNEDTGNLGKALRMRSKKKIGHAASKFGTGGDDNQVIQLTWPNSLIDIPKNFMLQRYYTAIRSRDMKIVNPA